MTNLHTLLFKKKCSCILNFR